MEGKDRPERKEINAKGGSFHEPSCRGGALSIANEGRISDRNISYITDMIRILTVIIVLVVLTVLVLFPSPLRTPLP